MKTTLQRVLAAASLVIGTTSCGLDGSQQVDRNRAPIAAGRQRLTVDPFDSRVFNWLFYVNNYADLLAAGIRSESAARSHWTRYGIAEGRQASPTFHTRQYLELYADLRAAFGSDYRAALDHFLTYGVSEHRNGFKDGGAYGRYSSSSIG